MLQWTAARWMNGQILSSTAIKCRVPQKGSKSRLQSTLRACQRSKYIRWCFVLSVGLYLLRHYLNGSPYLALLLCSSWMHHLDPGTSWQLLQVQIFMGGKESIYKEKCWSHLCTLFIGRGCLRYACPPYHGCVYLCKYIFDNIELNVMTRIEEELLALVMPC